MAELSGLRPANSARIDAPALPMRENILGYLLAIILGIFIGGLVNIFADDLPIREKPHTPHCNACSHPYRPSKWLGLIRLVGGGICPACDDKESRRSMLVELGMALAYVVLWNRHNALSLHLIANGVYFAVLVLIMITDLEHRLILHVVTFPAVLFALIASFWTVTPISALVGMLLGFCFFLVVYWLGGWVFGAGAMGFGDVTLATFIGAAVGFPLVVVALL
ncbi:MAG: prepilin peptidase, partial [Anaerolineales bacterium]|nr:prepilin peptidase [Anaerolineales bacterium]